MTSLKKSHVLISGTSACIRVVVERTVFVHGGNINCLIDLTG